MRLPSLHRDDLVTDQLLATAVVRISTYSHYFIHTQTPAERQTPSTVCHTAAQVHVSRSLQANGALFTKISGTITKQRY